MYTQDDLIDLLMSHLAEPKAAKAASRTGGRLFFSEYDIKKRLTGGAKRLTLPRGAIISPLATDWLVLNDIEIIQE